MLGLHQLLDSPRSGRRFIGSPRLCNLEDLEANGIFLSDIPPHDMAADFVLLAEQRQVEADLKEQYEVCTAPMTWQMPNSEDL